MTQVKRITKTLYVHRKPGREEDLIEACDMTRKDGVSGGDEWRVDYFGVMVGKVEATIEYTDIESDPTTALVTALQASLEKERADSHVRQLGIQQRIDELLAITHEVTDDE